METRHLLSIGQASKLCRVTQRTLRYYEELGLITPDKINEENNYRYYGFETMRKLQTIRYLRDEGFSLEEIRDMMEKDDLDVFQAYFDEQIEKTKQDIDYYTQRLESLNAWNALVIEGKAILRHQDTNVTSKFIPTQKYFFMEFIPSQNDENNSAFWETNYLSESLKNGREMVELGGAFNLFFDSFEDRINNRNQKTTILNSMCAPNNDKADNIAEFGGFTGVCCYHIGSSSTLKKTYEKMLEWADSHNFVLAGNALERHVLDSDSFVNEDRNVTEIILPTNEDAKKTAQLRFL